MRLAKRTLFVPKQKLEEFFGLPEGVEIMGVRPSSHANGWEFMLVSAGEVSVGDKKITIFQDDDNMSYRRIVLDTLQDAEGDIVRNFIPSGVKDPATYVIVEQSEAKAHDAQEIAQELVQKILKDSMKRGK
jgi:hypothetical protein